MAAKTKPNAIRAARRKAKISGSDLARRCGVTRASVNDWEKGRTKPSPDNAMKVSATLGIPLERIYGSAA